MACQGSEGRVEWQQRDSKMATAVAWAVDYNDLGWHDEKRRQGGNSLRNTGGVESIGFAQTGCWENKN